MWLRCIWIFDVLYLLLWTKYTFSEGEFAVEESNSALYIWVWAMGENNALCNMCIIFRKKCHTFWITMYFRNNKHLWITFFYPYIVVGLIYLQPKWLLSVFVFPLQVDRGPYTNSWNACPSNSIQKNQSSEET